jgi:hypothetical protein
MSIMEGWGHGEKVHGRRVTFEPDYIERYHSLLLAERIISDALTALLLINVGKEHPMINKTLRELRELREELTGSKEVGVPINYVGYALRRILPGESLTEMIRNLDQLIRVLDGSEKLNDENVKRLVVYFVEVARKLKENFKEERERVLGIIGSCRSISPGP